MSLTYESLSNFVLQFSALSCFPDFTKTPVGEALADYLTQAAEAYDGEQREYAETNVPIEPEQEDDGSNYFEEAGRILLGEEVE